MFYTVFIIMQMVTIQHLAASINKP